jgi:hypothetical protein
MDPMRGYGAPKPNPDREMVELPGPTIGAALLALLVLMAVLALWGWTHG